MSQKFYTLITQQGAALLANATALGVPLKLTKMAVGDGNGSATTPNANQTSLIHEVYQAPLNSLTTDEKNPNQIIAELVIPENQGGWFIHEIGLYDESNTLIAVGNCPATYKPQLSEGSGRTQVIRMIIIVDNVDCVALKIDPSVVLATRKYVDDLLSTTMQNHKVNTQQELQKEFNKLVPKITQINGYELKSNVTLTANDINALPAIKKIQAEAPTYEVGAQVNFGNIKIQGNPVARFMISKGANAHGWFEIYNDGFKRVGNKWPANNPLFSATPKSCVIIPFPIAFTENIISVQASIETTTEAVEIINYVVYDLTKIGLTAASIGYELTAMSSFACSYTAEGY
ncbi:hypothetical protein DKK79_03585 [Gilliamella apicola]|uniref:Phage tail fibre protein N-terminal domain-containing protein n=1 Tax=Gilliamella apicola TaxID=1196095 RepID=A0A2V4EMJ8_9GAMM|nr:phage tail protein [Gilliamella apicola]PXZ05768.1 hypothetical protein DKK79_03585 [Gilliamella apicola]